MWRSPSSLVFLTRSARYKDQAISRPWRERWTNGPTRSLPHRGPFHRRLVCSRGIRKESSPWQSRRLAENHRSPSWMMEWQPVTPFWSARASKPSSKLRGQWAPPRPQTALQTPKWGSGQLCCNLMLSLHLDPSLKGQFCRGFGHAGFGLRARG